MRTEYRYVDDRRDKEGDEAREGYVHRFHIYSAEQSDVCTAVEWMKQNLFYPQNIRVTRGSSSSGRTTEYWGRIVIKDIDDATLVRLHWGMDCFSPS